LDTHHPDPLSLRAWTPASGVMEAFGHPPT